MVRKKGEQNQHLDLQDRETVQSKTEHSCSPYIVLLANS